jgi:hypothetical protein
LALRLPAQVPMLVRARVRFHKHVALLLTGFLCSKKELLPEWNNATVGRSVD